jgi:hypothetical protein
MLICNAVFSVSAALMANLDAFIYSIHTFLAIVFAFIAIAIWSPGSLYHPAELAGLEREVPEPRHSRLIITLVILLSGFAYAGYQIHKFNKEQSSVTSKDCSEEPASSEVESEVLTTASGMNRWASFSGDSHQHPEQLF